MIEFSEILSQVLASQATRTAAQVVEPQPAVPVDEAAAPAPSIGAEVAPSAIPVEILETPSEPRTPEVALDDGTPRAVRQAIVALLRDGRLPESRPRMDGRPHDRGRGRDEGDSGRRGRGRRGGGRRDESEGFGAERPFPRERGQREGREQREDRGEGRGRGRGRGRGEGRGDDRGRGRRGNRRDERPAPVVDRDVEQPPLSLAQEYTVVEGMQDVISTLAETTPDQPRRRGRVRQSSEALTYFEDRPQPLPDEQPAAPTGEEAGEDAGRRRRRSRGGRGRGRGDRPEGSDDRRGGRGRDRAPAGGSGNRGPLPASGPARHSDRGRGTAFEPRPRSDRTEARPSATLAVAAPAAVAVEPVRRVGGGFAEGILAGSGPAAPPAMPQPSPASAESQPPVAPRSRRAPTKWPTPPKSAVHTDVGFGEGLVEPGPSEGHAE